MDNSYEPREPDPSTGTNPPTGTVAPLYLEERAQLDSYVQRELKEFQIKNTRVFPFMFQIGIPLILFTIGLITIDFHVRGGDTPINIVLAIAMIAFGTIRLIAYGTKPVMDSIKAFMSSFTGKDDENCESEEDFGELCVYENIKDEIARLLHLKGAPKFEDYLDVEKHEQQFFQYLNIASTPPLSSKRWLVFSFLTTGIVMTTTISFITFFIATTPANIALSSSVFIFTIVNCVNYVRLQRIYNQYHHDKAYEASHYLIEYCIYRSLWDERERQS